MSEQAHKNILIAVAGGSPATVTEVFWALKHKEQVTIDEVRIITTSVGEAAFRRAVMESGVWQECCHECDYATEVPVQFFVLKGTDKLPLEDIRNQDENELAANQISQLVRGWAQKNEERLYCSAAGGRKTLSIYLVTAIMLYGRLGDRIFHVLVDPPEFECKEFFHPFRQPRAIERTFPNGQPREPLWSGDVQIDLAPIPFVSVRELIPAGKENEQNDYLQIVEATQRRLQLQSPNLSLRISKMNFVDTHVPIEINGVLLELSPAAGVLYALLAEYCLAASNEEEKGLELDEISPHDLRRVMKALSSGRFDSSLLKAMKKTIFKTVAKWIEQLSEPTEQNLKAFKTSVEGIISRPLTNELRDQGVRQEYWVINVNRNLKDKETGEPKPARYQLDLPATAIHLPYPIKK